MSVFHSTFTETHDIFFLLISIGSIPDKIGSSSVQVDLTQQLTNLRRSFKDVSSFLLDGFDSTMGNSKT